MSLYFVFMRFSKKYNIQTLINIDISQKLNRLSGKLMRLIIFLSQKLTIQKMNPKIKYASIAFQYVVSILIQNW